VFVPFFFPSQYLASRPSGRVLFAAQYPCDIAATVFA
jgi:hypothetical protein